MQEHIRIKDHPPTRCPNIQCKANIYKEDIKGFIPILGMINGAIIQCHKCNDVIYLHIPIFLVDDWVKSLKSRPPISSVDEMQFNEMIENNFDEFMKYIKKN